MKKSFVATLALLAVVQLAQAASISITYQGGAGVPNLVDSTGTPLANTDPTLGLTVRVGYFDSIGGFNVAANAGNLLNLAAHWHQFDATHIGIPILPSAQGAFASSASSSDPQFLGQQIDLWVFKTTDNLSPNFSNFGNVSGYGLYTGASWVFPSTTVPPNNNQSYDTHYPTITEPGGIDQALYGTLNPGSSLGLAVVPEPSSVAILGLGFALVGLVRNRLRQ